MAGTIGTVTRTCPDCGGNLAKEQDLFHCKDHGVFFRYGPQLLVRAPETQDQRATVLLPWENQPYRRSR